MRSFSGHMTPGTTEVLVCKIQCVKNLGTRIPQTMALVPEKYPIKMDVTILHKQYIYFDGKMLIDDWLTPTINTLGNK